jgi:hypothetical protein
MQGVREGSINTAAGERGFRGRREVGSSDNCFGNSIWSVWVSEDYGSVVQNWFGTKKTVRAGYPFPESTYVPQPEHLSQNFLTNFLAASSVCEMILKVDHLFWL